MSERCPTDPLVCPFPDTIFDAWYRPIVMREGWRAAHDKILALVEGDVSIHVWLDNTGVYRVVLTDPITGSTRSV